MASLFEVPTAFALARYAESLDADALADDRVQQIRNCFLTAAITHIPRGDYNPITLSVKTPLTEQEEADLQRVFQEELGYRLVVSTPPPAVRKQSGFAQRLDFYIPSDAVQDAIKANADAAAARADANAAELIAQEEAATASTAKGKQPKKVRLLN